MKRQKYLLSVCVAAVLLLCLLVMPAEVRAASSGTCGENLTWVLDDAGTMTISGTGPMFSNPWGDLTDFYKESVRAIVIEDGVTTVGDGAFYDWDYVNSVVLGNTITSIGKSAFFYSGMQSLEIPNSVTTIGDCAFNSCYNLVDIVVPEGVTSIGALAFKNCEHAKSITLPSTVRTIGYGAFSNCSQLEEIKIPEGITVIEEETFFSCVALKTVTIPKSVKAIGNHAFGFTDELETVYYGADQAQWERIEVEYGNEYTLGYANVYFLGWYTKDGETFYSKNYKNLTGWQTINGNRYYFKKATGAMVSGVVKIGGVPNLFDKNGVWKKVITPPVITKQPVSVKVAKGKTATTTVTATGEGLKYTWYVLNPGASKYVKSSITKSTYSFAMDAAKSGRKVYCVVTDKYGQTVKSSTVTLSMAAAPKITKQPASVWVAKGKTATVSVTATGEGLKYTWYVLNPGASKYVKSSITKSSYSFTMSDDKNGRKVYCIVTDADGKEVKSNTVTMKIGTVKITKQPVSVKAAKNKMATVTVTATGEGLKYTWYVLNPGASKYVKSSITKSSYAFTMTADKSGRKVYCVVSDKYGQTVKTATVTMSMAAAPKITQQPVSVKVAKNKMATVTVTATGEGLKYTWYVLNPGASKYVKSSITKSSYAFTMTADKSGRKVYCVVTDKYGQTLRSSTVTMSMK